MEDNAEQKELFEFEKPKKRFFDIGGVLRRSGFENRIAITLELEKLVFISIGLIMLMVIVYALGVESGRADINKKKQAVKVVPAQQPALILKTPAQQPLPVVLPQPPAADMPYTIAVGSYKNRDSAVVDVGRLKSKGFDAFIKQSNQYYVVCVGSYADKTGIESKQALARIRQIRSDAYFRAR